MMSATRLFIPVCLAGVLFSAGAAPARETGTHTSELKLPMSADEVAARRRTVRDEIMVPSLAGIRGVAYRVVGFKDYEPLEKLMAGKLAPLSIAKIQMAKADGHYKDCDALVQITISRLGSHTVAELKVTQFASLVRNPKITVRAVTYSDKVYSAGHDPEKSVEKLCDEFVIDFLKANQKGFDPEKISKGPLNQKKVDSPRAKKK